MEGKRMYIRFQWCSWYSWNLTLPRSNFCIGSIWWRFRYRACIIESYIRLWSIIQICKMFARSWYIWFWSVICYSSRHSILKSQCTVTVWSVESNKESVMLMWVMATHNLYRQWPPQAREIFRDWILLVCFSWRYSMNDRGSICKFRNARSAFRNLHVDPLSFIPPWETNKSNSFLIFILYQKCTVLATKYPFFNTKHPVIILRGSLFVVTPAHVASWKNGCLMFIVAENIGSVNI